MSEHIMGAVAAVALREAEEISAALERACEASLQEGHNGVLVMQPAIGSAAAYTVTASHPDVPYGAIYYRRAT